MSEPASALHRLAAVIAARAAAGDSSSYTRQLLAAGVPRIARKLGEEAVELALAAVTEDDAALAAEAADLLYHLLVLLEARRVPLAAVEAVLDTRHGRSGLEEKAARPQG
jgi:phosphoribosyl-ATP pyrophosphohydrolase